jgi:hypothetical protein
MPSAPCSDSAMSIAIVGETGRGVTAAAATIVVGVASVNPPPRVVEAGAGGRFPSDRVGADGETAAVERSVGPDGVWCDFACTRGEVVASGCSTAALVVPSAPSSPSLDGPKVSVPTVAMTRPAASRRSARAAVEPTSAGAEDCPGAASCLASRSRSCASLNASGRFEA